MTRNVIGAKDYDIETVSISVADDLICGETRIRGYSIPTQNKVVEHSPIDICHQSVQRKKVFVHHFARKFNVIFNAMASRKLVWTLTMVIYTHHSRRYVLQGVYHYL
jgi:hypothetical protein